MADAKTVFSLSLRDEASKQLKNFQSNFDRTIKGAESSTAGFDDAVGALSGGLGGLAGAVGLGATAAAVGMVGMAINDMATQAGQLELVRSSFDNLASGAGQSSDAMLAAMRNASQGMVSDYDLILAANKAMMLGVADTGEELASLLEIARTRGQAMGLTLTQAFNDIVTGLGRESALILDNLGITIDTAAAMDAYAKQLNTTADALDGAQRKQALLNAVMAQTPASSGQAGSGVATAQQQAQAAQANAAAQAGAFFAPLVRDANQAFGDLLSALSGKWDAFKVAGREVGDAISSGILEGVQAERFVALQDAMSIVTQGMLAGAPVAELYADALRKIAEDAVTYGQVSDSQARSVATIAKHTQDAIKAIDAYRAAQDRAIEGAQVQASTQQLAIDATWRLSQAQRDGKAAAEAAAQGLNALSAVAAAGATDVASLEAAVRSLNNAMAGMAPILSSVTGMRQAAISQAQNLGLQAIQQGADPAQVTAMVANATDALWNMGLSYDATTEAQFQNQIAIQNGLAPLQSFTDGLRTANQEAQRLAAGGLAQSQKAFDDLRSSISNSVSAIVQESLGLGDITWPGSDGGGGDAANENARRLAAIANEGLIGQDWLGEFAAEVPDIFAALTAAADPAAAAQQMLVEFQQGLRPELLDFEMIKQRVRDELTSQQAIAAMTGELTSQLMAELGVSAAQVQSAMAGLGLPSTGAASTDQFGAGFEEGIDAQATAAGSLAKIAKAFLENESNVRASGGVVGAWWGEGFMAVVGDNVPPGLLDMLTSKLLPLILAGIAQRNSTTGTSDGN